MLSSGLGIVQQLNPQFAQAVRFLQAWVAYFNFTGSIVSGYRTSVEQQQLYAKGRTAAEVAARVKKYGKGGAVTDAPPGQSAHNYGLAIDVEGRDQAKIVALARQMGFGTVSWDPAHIEWPNWQQFFLSPF